MVGCAIARELALRGLSVVTIETHDTACQETSARNSRVIHSGFHEVPGTLKAKLAFEGSKEMSRYAEQRGIPILRTGMLIAVPHGSLRAGLWQDAGALWHLWKQGRRQGVAFQFVMTSKSVRQIAPVQAVAGIFIPTVAVICLEDLADCLVKDATAAGAEFRFGNEVRKIVVEKTDYVVRTSSDDVRVRALINSAGLTANQVSLMARGPNYPIEFIRGDYYELEGGIARWGIQTLVYPAMPPHSRSKGIHFGPRTDGRLYLGPSATSVSHPAAKDMFLDAARNFLPEIGEDDLRWAYSGVRPKYVTPNGLSDFVIRLDRSAPPLINLIGIDSPGLSACMSIARYVAEIVLSGL